MLLGGIEMIYHLLWFLLAFPLVRVFSVPILQAPTATSTSIVPKPGHPVESKSPAHSFAHATAVRHEKEGEELAFQAGILSPIVASRPHE